MADDGLLNLAMTSTGSRSGSSQQVSVSYKNPGDTPQAPQAGTASETTSEVFRPGEEQSNCPSDRWASLTTTASREYDAASTTHDSERPSVSVPGPLVLPDNVKVSPSIDQPTPSSQDGAKMRTSRLPKRLSAAGPVRLSSSPRRNVNGRTSPYNSTSLQITRGLSVSHGNPTRTTRKPVARVEPQSNVPTLHNFRAVSPSVPSVIAVKQTSINGKIDISRSSIPRPRHQFQLHQDADSESEIKISKLPRKKVGSGSTATDHKSDDGDLDTDEGGETKDESSVNCAPQSANKAGQSFPDASTKTTSQIAAGNVKQVDSFTPLNLGDSCDGKKSFPARCDNSQDDKSSTADSTPTGNTNISASQRRELIDQPFDRIKRLSVTAPKHGPTLRISESAERIIMGYRSADDFGDDSDNMPAQKRNSVPNLRPSIVMKELRKSTEGLLNGRLALSRSSTTHSLTRHELKERASDARNVKESSNSRFDSQSGLSKTKPSGSDDPFTTGYGRMRVEMDDLVKKDSPGSLLEWPLKTSPQYSAELRPVPEDSSAEGASWNSPLKDLQTATLSSNNVSLMKCNHDSLARATGNSDPYCEKPHPPAERRCGEGNSSTPETRKSTMPAKPSSVQSRFERTNNKFPPRTSSRGNTPDTLARSHVQLDHHSRHIPNRFKSAHPRRLSEDFSLPKSVTVNSETLRNSIHMLKDTEKSKTSTPTTREKGKAQLSGAKGMIWNIRGLFHKRSIDGPAVLSPANTRISVPAGRHERLAGNGSKYPNYQSRTLPATHGADDGAHGGAFVFSTPKDALPHNVPSKEDSRSGLDPDDYHQATDLALRLLDAARKEQDPMERSKLLQVSLSFPFWTRPKDTC